MGLWHTVRREVAGAWRSACYDVDRVVGRHRATRLRHAETKELAPSDLPRRRHRIAGAGGVVLLVVGGAAGTYLAVAGGLGALKDTLKEGKDAPPVAAPVQPSSPIQVAEGAPAPRRAAAGRPRRRPAPAPVPANPAVSPVEVVTTQPPRVPESTPSETPDPSPSVSESSTPSDSPYQGSPGH